eukprot:jgi/Mesvir1/17680/Mv10236-RA.2
MPLAFPVIHSEGTGGWGYRYDENQRCLQEEGHLQQVLKFMFYAERRLVGKIFLAQLYALHGFSNKEDQQLTYIRGEEKNNNRLRMDTKDNIKEGLKRLDRLGDRRGWTEDNWDEIANEEDESRVPKDLRLGTEVVLPSSSGIGWRARASAIQDNMAAIAADGGPSLFVTMTCNIRWPEITDNLPKVAEGEKQPSAYDYPEIVSRVFKQKLHVMLTAIRNGMFGAKPVYLIYVIEYQTRGLPHAHIIFRLPDEHHPTMANGKINEFMWAELPPKEVADGRLRKLVLEHMVHNHHKGTKCMKDRRGQYVPMPPRGTVRDEVVAESTNAEGVTILPEMYDERPPTPEESSDSDDGGYRPRRGPPTCAKRFPQAFCNETYEDVRGFIHPRRRPTSKLNSWIVPYCAALLLLLACHINVEVVARTQVVMYLNKYINKGHEKSEIRVVPCGDEPAEYLEARVVPAMRAIWVILGFPERLMEPGCELLDVHEEDQQKLAFKQGMKQSMKSALGERSETTLTMYFARPSEIDYPGMGALTYKEFFERYRVDRPRGFDSSGRPRPDHALYQEAPANALRYGGAAKPPTGAKGADRDTSNIIMCRGKTGARWFIVPRERRHYCRLRIVDMRNPNLFRLSVLLLKRPGTSFQSLRTVDGVEMTYERACRQLGLLEDDNEAVETMRQATKRFCLPHQVRRLFAVLVLQKLATPEQLWKFKDEMSRDHVFNAYDVRRGWGTALKRAVPRMDRDVALARTLAYLDRRLGAQGYNVWELEPEINEQRLAGVDVCRSRDFGAPEEEVIEPPDTSKFLLEQSLAYNFIMGCVNGDRPQRRLFVDGPAGTGKTTVLNAVMQECARTGREVIPMAFTGVASLQLRGGRTSHFCCGFPLAMELEHGSGISKESERGRALIRAGAIIVDEVGMMNKNLVHSMDRLLRDLMGKRDEPFGGKLVVFAGDFRQVAPVVEGAGPSATLDASVTNSSLWPGVTRLSLTTNHRSKNDPKYCDMLLEVGGDRVACVPVPDSRTGVAVPMVPLPLVPRVDTEEELLNHAFPDVYDSHHCMQSAVVVATNAKRDEINKKMLERLRGNVKTAHSYDALKDESHKTEVPHQTLNMVRQAGVPEHQLEWKPGAVAMLTRNLSHRDGLLNGTRVVLVDERQFVFIVRTLDGRVFAIPRIKFTIAGDKFTIVRTMYPIVLAWGITVHKCQGQTLLRVSVDFRDEYFGHGMLYTALSRVAGSAHIRGLFAHVIDGVGYCRNVVLRPILKNAGIMPRDYPEDATRLMLRRRARDVEDRAAAGGDDDDWDMMDLGDGFDDMEYDNPNDEDAYELGDNALAAEADEMDGDAATLRWMLRNGDPLAEEFLEQHEDDVDRDFNPYGDDAPSDGDDRDADYETPDEDESPPFSADNMSEDGLSGMSFTDENPFGSEGVGMLSHGTDSSYADENPFGSEGVGMSSHGTDSQVSSYADENPFESEDGGCGDGENANVPADGSAVARGDGADAMDVMDAALDAEREECPFVTELGGAVEHADGEELPEAAAQPLDRASVSDEAAGAATVASPRPNSDGSVVSREEAALAAAAVAPVTLEEREVLDDMRAACRGVVLRPRDATFRSSNGSGAHDTALEVVFAKLSLTQMRAESGGLGLVTPPVAPQDSPGGALDFRVAGAMLSCMLARARGSVQPMCDARDEFRRLCDLAQPGVRLSGVGALMSVLRRALLHVGGPALVERAPCCGSCGLQGETGECVVDVVDVSAAPGTLEERTRSLLRRRLQDSACAGCNGRALVCDRYVRGGFPACVLVHGGRDVRACGGDAVPSSFDASVVDGDSGAEVAVVARLRGFVEQRGDKHFVFCRAVDAAAGLWQVVDPVEAVSAPATVVDALPHALVLCVYDVRPVSQPAEHVLPESPRVVARPPGNPRNVPPGDWSAEPPVEPPEPPPAEDEDEDIAALAAEPGLPAEVQEARAEFFRGLFSEVGGLHSGREQQRRSRREARAADGEQGEAAAPARRATDEAARPAPSSGRGSEPSAPAPAPLGSLFPAGGHSGSSKCSCRACFTFKELMLKYETLMLVANELTPNGEDNSCPVDSVLGLGLIMLILTQRAGRSGLQALRCNPREGHGEHCKIGLALLRYYIATAEGNQRDMDRFREWVRRLLDERYGRKRGAFAEAIDNLTTVLQHFDDCDLFHGGRACVREFRQDLGKVPLPILLTDCPEEWDVKTRMMAKCREAFCFERCRNCQRVECDKEEQVFKREPRFIVYGESGMVQTAAPRIPETLVMDVLIGDERREARVTAWLSCMLLHYGGDHFVVLRRTRPSSVWEEVDAHRKRAKVRRCQDPDLGEVATIAIASCYCVSDVLPVPLPMPLPIPARVASSPRTPARPAVEQTSQPVGTRVCVVDPDERDDAMMRGEQASPMDLSYETVEHEAGPSGEAQSAVAREAALEFAQLQDACESLLLLQRSDVAFDGPHAAPLELFYLLLCEWQARSGARGLRCLSFAARNAPGAEDVGTDVAARFSMALLTCVWQRAQGVQGEIDAAVRGLERALAAMGRMPSLQFVLGRMLSHADVPQMAERGAFCLHCGKAHDPGPEREDPVPVIGLPGTMGDLGELLQSAMKQTLFQSTCPACSFAAARRKCVLRGGLPAWLLFHAEEGKWVGGAPLDHFLAALSIAGQHDTDVAAHARLRAFVRRGPGDRLAVWRRDDETPEAWWVTDGSGPARRRSEKDLAGAPAAEMVCMYEVAPAGGAMHAAPDVHAYEVAAAAGAAYYDEDLGDAADAPLDAPAPRAADRAPRSPVVVDDNGEDEGASHAAPSDPSMCRAMMTSPSTRSP